MSLSDIPVAIFLEILLPQLAVADILAIAAASRFFYRVANDEVLWQILTLRDYKLIFPQAAWVGEHFIRSSGTP
ncbi:hypothetical protein BC936DRAFT_149981 [Jimgerdemannia flammicorona]|uniref:F-box domain-containing protein n=1 Tax=Jimgerdemannia flammicorona TaxID=994334 RepID=A0A433CZR9_9FUNG|nr:hypothetical protein BC936DRAFT_149981 [Jimgerdemannia flammicorona]